MRTLTPRDLAKARELSGDVTQEDLRHVESYVGERLAVFIPSVGDCGFATRHAHSHPSWSFSLYFAPGSSRVEPTITIPESHYFALAIEPDFPHEELPSEEFRRYAAVMIERDFFRSTFRSYGTDKPLPSCRLKQFAVHKDAFLYVKKFMSERDPIAGGPSPMALALEETIAHTIARGLAGTSRVTAGASANMTVQRVSEYVEQNYARRITLEELAEVARLSPSRFGHVFKKETGLSPIGYITEVRIGKAKLMLDDRSMSVTEIAHACGFYDASHFSSTFARLVGMTASQYAELFETG